MDGAIDAVRCTHRSRTFGGQLIVPFSQTENPLCNPKVTIPTIVGIGQEGNICFVRRSGPAETIAETMNANVPPSSNLVEQAVMTLSSSFGELAPAEALLRALIAERTDDRSGAAFWVSVYQRLASPG
ncbi:hypothetical protein [Pararhizobium haloflavum]|uniref:hypothetical protein n=1 Tax=Pararhizobium haloflavum TaxID=2037914 RepID=UPI0013001577|nr:hypothetical protein [Pararhizobium haloflavum]